MPRVTLDNISMTLCSSERLPADRGKSDVESRREGPQHGYGVQCYRKSGAIHSLAQGLHSRRPVRPAHKAAAYRSVHSPWLDAAPYWVIVALQCECCCFKPLIDTLKPQSNGPSYSNTVISTSAVDEWAVTFGTATRGLGGLRPRPVPSSLYQM